MKTQSPSILHSSLALMSVRLVLQQIGVAAVVFLLYALWLRVPDASALDVVGSVCLGLLVISIAGAGESVLMLQLADRPRTTSRLFRGTLFLLAGAVLWLGWLAMLAHLRGNDNSNNDLLAGYLNSRFPHQLRNVFTFEHILRWLGWMWTTLDWIGAGILAAFICPAIMSARPIHGTLRSLRSIAYWWVVIFVSAGASIFSGAVLAWIPGHGLRIEMASLILRLIVLVVVDGTGVCFVLAMLAMLAGLVRQVDTPNQPQSTPVGTPNDNQPRTAEAP